MLIAAMTHRLQPPQLSATGARCSCRGNEERESKVGSDWPPGTASNSRDMFCGDGGIACHARDGRVAGAA
jgi:hypothetical protein